MAITLLLWGFGLKLAIDLVAPKLPKNSTFVSVLVIFLCMIAFIAEINHIISGGGLPTDIVMNVK